MAYRKLKHLLRLFRNYSLPIHQNAVATFLGLILLFSSLSLTEARASKRLDGIILMGSHISEVHDLKKIRAVTKWKHVKLGFQHQYFRLFYLPIWGDTSGHYVLYTKKLRKAPEFQFLNAKTEKAIALALGKKELDPEPFSTWEMTWGNLPLFAIIGVIWFRKRRRSIA